LAGAWLGSERHLSSIPPQNGEFEEQILLAICSEETYLTLTVPVIPIPLVEEFPRLLRRSCHLLGATLS
jgi:hypothetical protein